MHILHYDDFFNEAKIISNQVIRNGYDIEIAINELRLKREKQATEKRSIGGDFKEEIWCFHEPHIKALANEMVKAYRNLKRGTENEQ
jgi:hypothetical protein